MVAEPYHTEYDVVWAIEVGAIINVLVINDALKHTTVKGGLLAVVVTIARDIMT